MNEDQLNAFIAIIDAGSFSAAAQLINLTQPAISQRIKSLEVYIGHPLFERSPGRSSPLLTEAGRILETEARSTLARWRELRHELQERTSLRRGLVTIGGGATAVSMLLPKVIARVLAMHPGLNVRVRESGSSEVIKRVLHGEVDLGIITNSGEMLDPQLLAQHLRDDRIVPVVSSDHPLVSRGELLNPQDFAGERIVAYESTSAIGEVISRSLQRHHVEARVWTELRSIHSILEVARMTMSVALVSEISKPLWGEMVQLHCPQFEADMSRSLQIITKKDYVLTSSCRLFLKELIKNK